MPPYELEAWSPNHGDVRRVTVGCVIHSTRGNGATEDAEFNGTLNWFRNPASEVSAHVVIGATGEIAYVVRDELVAWHAGEHNASFLGAELTQPRLGDPIFDEQYKTLAWWLRRMADKYGFAPNAYTLPEHRQTVQGQRVGKTDVGLPYSYAKLATYL